MIDELTKDFFKARVGEKFTVKSETPPAKTELTLKEVAEAPDRLTLGPDGKPLMESFRVIFEGASEQSLPQRIYDFEHAKLGTFSLFMVPVVSKNPAVKQYEVVFNRLLHRPE